jgi:hypothetical protein
MLETAHNLRGISANFKILQKISRYWKASEKCIATNAVVSSCGKCSQQTEQEYRWELDLHGQYECGRHQVLSLEVKDEKGGLSYQPALRQLILSESRSVGATA